MNFASAILTCVSFLMLAAANMAMKLGDVETAVSEYEEALSSGELKPSVASTVEKRLGEAKAAVQHAQRKGSEEEVVRTVAARESWAEAEPPSPCARTPQSEAMLATGLSTPQPLAKLFATVLPSSPTVSPPQSQLTATLAPTTTPTPTPETMVKKPSTLLESVEKQTSEVAAGIANLWRNAPWMPSPSSSPTRNQPVQPSLSGAAMQAWQIEALAMRAAQQQRPLFGRRQRAAIGSWK